jgi:hypothetical protein
MGWPQGRKRLKYRQWGAWERFLFHLKTDGLLTLGAGTILFGLYSLVSWLNALDVALPWFGVFAGLFVIVFTIEAWQDPYKGGHLFYGMFWSTILFSFVASAGIATAVTLIYSLWKVGTPWVLETYRALREFRFRTWLTLLAAVVTLGVGALFFIFRLRQRFLYGATEALAGAAVAAHRLSVEPGQGVPNDGGFYFAVFTAGVYLVVRGIDNMHVALHSGADPFLRWARGWLELRKSAAAAVAEEIGKDEPT